MKLKRFLVILLVIILSITSTGIMFTNADTPRLYGDINNDGKINGMDLLLMKKIILGVDLSQFSEEDIKYADVITHNGTVNGMRLLMLKKCILGIIGPEDLQPEVSEATGTTEATEPPETTTAPDGPDNGFRVLKLIDWSETNLCDKESIFEVSTGSASLNADKTNAPDILTGNKGQLHFVKTGSDSTYSININPAAGKTEEAKKYYKDIMDELDYYEGIQFDINIVKFDRNHTSIYSHFGVKTNGYTANTRSLELKEHPTFYGEFWGQDLEREITLRIPFQNLNHMTGGFSSWSIVTHDKITELEFYISNIYIYGWQGESRAQIPTHDDGSDTRVGFTGKDYKLAWVDNFEDNSLNMDNWSYQDTVFNTNEKAAYLQERVEVKDGKLIMSLDKASTNKYAVYSYDWNIGAVAKLRDTPFGGSALTSSSKVTFQYGMLEMKVKLPFGTGMWSGLWTVGTEGKGWPYSGEIDIVEYMGALGDNVYPICLHFCAPRTPDTDAYYGGHISGVMNPYYGGNTREYNVPVNGKLSDNFNIIGIEWTNKEIIFYMNGIRFRTMEIDNREMRHAYHNPHQIHLQQSCDTGGSSGNANNNPELAAGRMQTMEIDWIKIWQSNDVPGSRLILKGVEQKK